MQNHLNKFKVDKKKKSLTEEEQSIISEGFTFFGKPMDVESPKCIAKRCTDTFTGTRTYWIKKSTKNGQLVNHHSPDFKDDISGFNKMHGKGNYVFVKVNADCFDAYMRFLQSDNTLHLRHAERLR